MQNCIPRSSVDQSNSLEKEMKVSPEVIAAMLEHRTKDKKVFWEFDSIIMQNMSHNIAIA